MEEGKVKKQVIIELTETGDVDVLISEELDMTVWDVLVLLTLAETKVKIAYFNNRLGNESS